MWHPLTPLGRFCKLRWYKLHQQRMSTLYTNRNTQAVLLGNSLLMTLQTYKVMEYVFRERHLKLWYTSHKVKNLLQHAENLEFLPILSDKFYQSREIFRLYDQKKEQHYKHIHHRTSTPWLQRSQHKKQDQGSKWTH